MQLFKYTIHKKYSMYKFFYCANILHIVYIYLICTRIVLWSTSLKTSLLKNGDCWVFAFHRKPQQIRCFRGCFEGLKLVLTVWYIFHFNFNYRHFFYQNQWKKHYANHIKRLCKDWFALVKCQLNLTKVENWVHQY